MAAAAATNNLMSRLLAAAKADPKKAGALAVLVAVLGTMWVRMAVDRGGPQSAAAAPVAASDNDTLSRARASARGGGGGAASAAMAQWRSRPVSPVVRNLFVVEFDNYAQQGARVAGPVTRVEEGFWDELAKSLSSRADQKKQREILVENTLLQAEKLKLQTIVMGAAPSAVINGEMVGVGTVVAGFRVSRIEARRIIVEREGIKLEIPMK